MVTDNQRTTIVLLATVLLLAVVPYSQSMLYAFADTHGLTNDFKHVTASFAFAPQKDHVTGLGHSTSWSSVTSIPGTSGDHGWYQSPDQQMNEMWHHGKSRGGQTNNINNIQNADCSSTSTSSGGNANGGGGGSSNGGSGGATSGGSGGGSTGGNGGATPGGNGGTGGTGGPGGPSNGGSGSNAFGGDAGLGGAGTSGSSTTCSNKSTFHVSNGF